MFDIKKFSKNLVAFLFLLFFVFSIFSFDVFATNDNFGQNFVGNEINLSSKDPRTIASQIINVSLSILGIIAVVIVIYGGFVWMSSEGNEEKISKAKGILKSGSIGLAIILSAWGITSLIFRQLGDATGTNGVVYCENGSIKSCGCGGVSTCADNRWGSCVGSSCLPGSEGSWCSSGLGNSCQPDNTLCNSNLVCNNECKCTQPGVGDPCGETIFGVCNNELEPFCSNPNLTCDANTCTCQSGEDEEDNFSELGEPCGDGLEGACQSDKLCNLAHGLSCESCVCAGNPVITGLNPVGGFCRDDINKACSEDSDCSSGVCDKETPNAAAGNFITIKGYNFDEYSEMLSGVNFINRSNNSLVAGRMPSEVNSYCGNTWSNTQIIVSVPSGFVVSDDVAIEVITKTGKKDYSDDENGPQVGFLKINSISRPGLCRISPQEAKANDPVLYYGVNLNNSKAYFGNYSNNVSGFTPNVFSDNLSGTIVAPNLKVGDTSTFAKKLDSSVPSNFLDFKKMPEPPKAPSISFFEPIIGRPGQYITIYGSGFGSSRGSSQVYFYNGVENIPASFDFPAVCLHSVWRDDQIIVKLPENIDYNNPLHKISLKIGTWDEVFSEGDKFVASSTYPLLPSLCKLSPNSGPAKTSKISLWGEYFKEQNLETKAVFNFEKISDSLSVVSDGGADKAESMVVDGSITGPVKISRGGLTGNGINFVIKSCSSNNDCSSGEVCCGSQTTNPGACVSNINDCLGGAPNSSVFEWGFDTGFDDGDIDEDDENIFSCASYNFCPEAYVCPNSPGQCSSYDGNKKVETGVCNRTCTSFEFCTEEGCEYDQIKDVCSTDAGMCSPQKTIVYNLGDGVATTTQTAICKEYNIPNFGQKFFYELDIKTSCPSGWSKMPSGKCVDSSLSNNWQSTCSVCRDGFSCSLDGKCLSPKLCPSDSSCSADNKCLKNGAPSCDCCCSISENSNNGNPSCCSPLTCSYSCGISASLNSTNNNFGLCSGCGDVSGDYIAKDLACNCTGTSGKYCDVGPQYPSGACLDCTSLGESACKEHSATCCFDNVNGVCRGGASDASVWGDASSNIGYCPYYRCDSTNSSVCFDEPSRNGDYKTKTVCDKACSENCKQWSSASDCISNNTCCWDAKNNVCSSGNRFEAGDTGGEIGYCKRYDCSTVNNLCATESPNTSGKYLQLDICQNSCKEIPIGFGESCSDNVSTTTAVCSDVCNKLDCLTDGGSLGTAPDCGFCCCDPNAPSDQCSAINEKLSCYKDKDSCSGENRGLCCGCTSDDDCARSGSSAEEVGCGMDSCCKARPEVLETFPANNQKGICHNASISIKFNKKMDTMSLANNILLLEESSSACSSGTYFISEKEPGLFEEFKSLASRYLSPLVRIFKTNVFAATDIGPPSVSIGNISSPSKVYCSVLGFVDFRQESDDKTVAIFKPKSILKENTKYFVVVKGDNFLNSSNGVLSSDGIGMNGRGYEVLSTGISDNLGGIDVSIVDITEKPKPIWVEGEDVRLKFNNLNFVNSHIFSFNTINAPADQGGICSVEKVLISPDSYLFPENTNNLQENDNDPNSSSFDSSKDHDKAYYAYAISKDDQILNPVNGYSWTWMWSVGNANIINFKDVVVSWSNNGNKRLLAVRDNVKDAQTTVVAKVKMSTSNFTLNGDGVLKSVPAYVFVCKNPWPPVNNDGTWSPWRDSLSSFGNYNYEFYYCRDAGGDSTSDDLPAFLSNLAIVKGPSPINTCSNLPSRVCSNNNDCPAGGICISNFLKEAYFFKERMPKFIDYISASDIGSGGEISVSWGSDKALVDKYKIYYKSKDEAVFQEKIIQLPDTSVCNENGEKYSCVVSLKDLSNYVSYEIKITALSENLAETNFSSMANVTPTESGISGKPTNPKVEIVSQDERLIKISWTAPSIAVSKYKVYRGSASGVYGSSILTQDNSTEISISLAGTQNDTFYFVISSINPVDVESEKSSEIFVSLVDQE